MTQTVTIDRFRTVPAPLAGIGWVAVERWDDTAGRYVHVSTFRSQTEAGGFIERLESRPAS